MLAVERGSSVEVRRERRGAEVVPAEEGALDDVACRRACRRLDTLGISADLG